MNLTLSAPWLSWDLGGPHQVLSWSLNRPGFVETDTLIWREVRNADLPQDFDVETWLARELHKRDQDHAVALLTSRNLLAYETATAEVEGIRAECLATTGLSNAERIGQRVDRSGKDWGTINVALRLSAPLSQAALLETLSIVTQARTAAVMEACQSADFTLPGGIPTGTGTDCIAVAAPAGNERFAGLHTALGEVSGRAVYEAVRKGADIWMQTVRRPEEI